MQTLARPGKPSKPAKGVTREEFIDFMKRAQQAVYKKLQDAQAREVWERAVGRWGVPGNDPIFSFDHPNIHGGNKPGIIMAAMGLTRASHFMLPANSCDIHKIIEHLHARLVGAFQKWLYEDSTKYNLDVYKRRLEQIFYTCPEIASPPVIQKEVNSLPALFQELIDIKGAWPPKAWR